MDSKLYVPSRIRKHIVLHSQSLFDASSGSKHDTVLVLYCTVQYCPLLSLHHKYGAGLYHFTFHAMQNESLFTHTHSLNQPACLFHLALIFYATYRAAPHTLHVYNLAYANIAYLLPYYTVLYDPHYLCIIMRVVDLCVYLKLAPYSCSRAHPYRTGTVTFDIFNIYFRFPLQFLPNRLSDAELFYLYNSTVLFSTFIFTISGAPSSSS